MIHKLKCPDCGAILDISVTRCKKCGCPKEFLIDIEIDDKPKNRNRSFKLPYITEPYIRKCVNLPVTYNKGKKYFNEGRVSNLQHNENCTEFKAFVQGSLDYPYNCVLEFDGDKLVKHKCDCPAHYNYSNACKHIVAVLLEIREQRLKTERANRNEERKPDQPKDKQTVSLGGEEREEQPPVSLGGENAEIKREYPSGYDTQLHSTAEWCEQKNKYVIQTYYENLNTKIISERQCKECDETCSWECEFKRNHDKASDTVSLGGGEPQDQPNTSLGGAGEPPQNYDWGNGSTDKCDNKKSKEKVRKYKALNVISASDAISIIFYIFSVACVIMLNLVAFFTFFSFIDYKIISFIPGSAYSYFTGLYVFIPFCLMVFDRFLINDDISKSKHVVRCTIAMEILTGLVFFILFMCLFANCMEWTPFFSVGKGFLAFLFIVLGVGAVVYQLQGHSFFGGSKSMLTVISVFISAVGACGWYPWWAVILIFIAQGASFILLDKTHFVLTRNWKEVSAILLGIAFTVSLVLEFV